MDNWLCGLWNACHWVTIIYRHTDATDSPMFGLGPILPMFDVQCASRPNSNPQWPFCQESLAFYSLIIFASSGLSSDGWTENSATVEMYTAQSIAHFFASHSLSLLCQKSVNKNTVLQNVQYRFCECCCWWLIVQVQVLALDHSGPVSLRFGLGIFLDQPWFMLSICARHVL